MQATTTWNDIYEIWNRHAEKLDPKLKQGISIIKIKVEPSIMPEIDNKLDWLPQSDCKLMMDLMKKKKMDKVCPNLTPGMKHSIKLFQMVENNPEKIALIWASAFLQNMKRIAYPTNSKNKKLITQLIHIIQEKQQEYHLEPYSDDMIKTCPVYIFSPNFIQ